MQHNSGFSMATVTSTALRRPNKKGFMAPYVVLEMAAAVEDVLGPDAREAALKDAQLFRLPESNEPVREDKAARLHQVVRARWPDQARDIAELAGTTAADRIIESQFTSRARSMLARMPRATGAWLLAKTAHQNAWIFSGTGEFVVESAQRFILRDNPLVIPGEADVPVCYFHASLFQRLFCVLIHPRLTCREVTCKAAGDKACVFEFTMSPVPSA